MWIPGTPQFQPSLDTKLCNDLSPAFSGPADLQGGGGTCTPVTTPGGSPDTTLTFTLPQGHMNYDQSNFIVAGGASETRLDGASIPGPNPGGQTGAAAGGLESITTLGLAANPCQNTIFPDFIWWEAEFSTTATIACLPEGTPDRWSNMAFDGGDPWPGQADKDSPAVTAFPDCTLKLFDPDGDGIDTDGNPATIGDQPVQPRARFAGLTQVPPGADWQMLQNVEFDPGDLQAAFLANPDTTQHPYAKLPPGLGFVNVIVLNDPKAVILQPTPLSDFCSPLSSVGMLKGQIDTNGDTVPDTPRVTSPATPASYQVQARTQSVRDADGDAIENSFDTCVWAANTPAEDPYVTSGPDVDMLDSACDPAPGTMNSDQDGDGYFNPQDWCPLVANPLPGGETDSENAQLYNTAAPDGGPQSDQIGDGCDDENGGDDAVSDGLYFNAIYVDSVCIEGGGVVDNDGDGWCTDTDPNDTIPNDIGGTFSNQMPDATDPDGDGWSSDDEWTMGTDPLNDCPLIYGHDAWPPDFDMNRVVNIMDVFYLLPPNVGPRIGDADYSPRRDLNADGINGVLDIAHLVPPMFGSTCPGPYVPPTAAGSINEIAIDMDITGNDARLTGGADIQDCGEIDSGGTNTIDIDVILPPPGIHASDGIEVFEFVLNYDPAVVNVSAEDQNLLLVQAGASDTTNASDPLPDSGGSWRSGGFESVFMPADPEPVGGHEVGPGVLTRITLTGVAQGTTALTLTKVGAMTGYNGTIPIVTVSNAMVTVDEPCEAGPSPAPQVCEEFPPAGMDDFPTSGARVTIELEPDFGGGSEEVLLDGPTTVDRSDPSDGNPGSEELGPDATEPDGLGDIETEMVSMNLTGTSALFGPVTLRESPSRESNGAIETKPGSGTDFPADSFFDVYFEMDVTLPMAVTAFNPDPFRMNETIRCIPPEGSGYQPRPDEPVFADMYIDLDGDPAEPNLPENMVLIGRVIHARHIPLPEKPLFSVRPAGPSGLNPAHIYTITSAGAAPSVCVADAALGISGAGGDDLNAHSLTEFSTEVRDIRFSVDDAPLAGLSLGLPGTGVNAEATKIPPEAHGDEFNLPVLGTNALFMDESLFGLQVSDDIDALAEPPPGGCPPPAPAVAFSLAAGSPTLVPAAATPDDILIPPGAPGCPGPAPCVAVDGAALGLVAADDLDALCWYDLNSDDLPDASDSYLFSLTPGSPSLGTTPANPDDLLAAGPSVFMAAPALGLRGAGGPDDLDGMKCPLGPPGAIPAGLVEDQDADGVADPIDNCLYDPNQDQADTVDGDGIGDVCDDSDGDGAKDATDGCPLTPTQWPTPHGDGDCDGFTDDDEVLITTDPGDGCPDDPADDVWPCDFDMNTVINITDLFEVLPPYFGSSPSIPDTNGDGIIDWSVRRDLAPDGVINITDVFLVLPPYFGSSCTP